MKAEGGYIIDQPSPRTPPPHPHVLWMCPRRPPREQTTELCFDFSWFMRSVIRSVLPLRKQAPREPLEKLL